MRIFQTKWFVRFARKEKISNATLRDAVERAEQGLVDADLGGHVIKQRVARPGKGKRGGYRTLIYYWKRETAIFAYGFGKNDRENITDDELEALKAAAKVNLSLTARQLATALAEGALVEVPELKDEDDEEEAS